MIGVGDARGEDMAGVAVVRIIGAGRAMRVVRGAHGFERARVDECGGSGAPALWPGPVLCH